MPLQDKSHEQPQAPVNAKTNAAYVEPAVREEAPLTSVTGSAKTTND